MKARVMRTRERDKGYDDGGKYIEGERIREIEGGVENEGKRANVRKTKAKNTTVRRTRTNRTYKKLVSMRRVKDQNNDSSGKRGV